MKKGRIFLIIVLSIVGIGIAIPHLIYQDAKNVSQKDIKTAKESADIFDHPLDFLQIIKLVVREKQQDTIFVDVYTFFGLKYAVLEVVLHPRTGQGDRFTILCPPQPRGGLNPVCRQQ